MEERADGGLMENAEWRMQNGRSGLAAISVH
jgi:hypothetical protein